MLGPRLLPNSTSAGLAWDQQLPQGCGAEEGGE